MRLHKKVAIVTGGAQGIGGGITSRFANEGATVVIADLNEEKAQQLAATLSASGATVTAIRCDVADQAQVAALFA